MTNLNRLELVHKASLRVITALPTDQQDRQMYVCVMLSNSTCRDNYHFKLMFVNNNIHIPPPSPIPKSNHEAHLNDVTIASLTQTVHKAY